MARTTPRVQQGRLKIQHGSQAIVVDSPAWFSWLAEHRIFRFTSPAGTFTARREPRAAGWYWYAYRRQHGSLRSAYLGKTEELTLLRLTEVANGLSSAPVPASPAVGTPEPRFLLTTKMTPPPLSPSLVARPRLFASLRKHVAWKLFLVTGPAGSGKTTLLSTWLRELSCPVAWLSLDEGDNDLARFWRYMLAALQKQVPGFATQLLTLLPTLQGETLEPFLTLLINALATLPGEIVLVLDDYHLLTSQAVQESVTFLIEHGPDHLRLIVASRTLPSLPLPRLRAHGVLAELGFADLRFTQQETRELLRRLVDIELSSEELSRLVASTEGWVTGLTLAALASRASQSGVTSVFESHRENPATFEYLASEVLAHQPEAVRDFLLSSSILDRFNGALCDAVTLHQDSQHLLRQLAQENLFLSPLDEHHLSYRYHQLFAAFLRSHLDQQYPGQAEVLHRRAAAWYTHHGMPVEAIEHALRAHDFALAAHLIEQHGRDMLMRHEVLGLRTWLRALPEEVVSARPCLCIYAAWTLLHTSHTLPVEGYLCAAERSLTSDSIPEAQRRALSGEIAAIRARLAIYQNRTEQSVALAHQALLLLAESDDAVRGEVALSLGATHEVRGETHEAEKAYREAIGHSKNCGNLRAAMLATRSLALLYADQGRLRQACKLYQDGLAYALQTQQEKLPPVGFMYVGLGELCYEWNDLEAAEHHLREGIALGQRGGDVKIWLLGSIGLISTTLARGDREQGRSLFAEAERQARQTHFQRGVAWLQSIRLRFCALQGHVTPLLDWMQEYGLDPAQAPDMLHEDEYQQLAQALIACNEPDRALPILYGLLERVEQAQRFGRKIPLLLDLAHAYERQGASSQTLETLAEALALAEPQGYIRTFLDEGAQIAAPLRTLHQSSRRETQTGTAYPSGYLKQLLALFRHEQTARVSRERAASPPEQLSSRELEVLRLLAAGHSYADIAEMLVIGLNTVKTHVKNIYGKLGARNRTQAIAHARALHLL